MRVRRGRRSVDFLVRILSTARDDVWVIRRDMSQKVDTFTCFRKCPFYDKPTKATHVNKTMAQKLGCLRPHPDHSKR